MESKKELLKKSKEYESEHIVYSDLRDLSFMLNQVREKIANDNYTKKQLLKQLKIIEDCVDQTLHTRETVLIPFVEDPWAEENYN